jgi:hypothetical protein
MGLVLVVSAVAYAADVEKVDTSKTRIIKPFSELKDLSAEQVEKLKVIHRKHLDAVKALEAKQHEELMDVLTDGQKKELAEIQEKDRVDKKKAKMKEADAKGAAAEKEPVKEEVK